MKKILFFLSCLFIAFVSRSQCNASFAFTQNAGGNITFTSTSTGVFPGTYYQWDYGDATSGSGTNLTNTSHTYPGNGNYTATLTVFNASVCSSSYTQNILITTSPCSVAVNASYTYSNAVGGIVSFTSTSTGTTATSTYFWRFGDGGTSNLMNPSHTYSANGNFTAKLYVANGPCSDSIISAVTVTTVPCSLVPSFTYSNSSSGQLYFVSTSTGTNSSTMYSWSFGDATTGNGNPIYHTYATNGTYTVTLTLTNSTFTAPSTCSASTSQTVSLSTSPCTTAINASFTYTNTGAGNVNFTSTSTGTTSSSTYTWSFGDATTSNVMNPSHTYSANSNFYVTLKVKDGACTSSTNTTIPITSLPCALVPSFTYSNSSSGQFYFVSTSTGTVSGTSYTWNFGDATTGYGNPIYHTYAANGTYSVTLTLSNPSMSVSTCSASVTQTVLMTTSPCSMAINSSFTYTNTGGGNVNFTSTSTGTTASSTYSWSFGDSNSSTVMNPSHTYSANGSFNVILKVTDGACNSTKMITVPISSLPCSLVPSFTYTTTSSSGQVYFTSTSTGTVSGSTYYWDFGDATYGYVDPIYHTYATPGTYSVILVVTNPSSTLTTCSASVAQNVSITTTACLANPTFTLAKVTSTAVVWNAYPTYPASITNAVWSWGDATSSTGLYPSHTYSATGWYNICLTVTVSCAATGSTCVLSNIYRMQAGNQSAGMAQINVISSVGINELKQNDASFNLYPNPNNGTFNVILDPKYNDKPCDLVIYNMLGEIIYKTRFEANENLIKEIDLNNTPNGAYFIKLNTTKGSYSKKLIISK
jgi:PKD repeat protein